MSRLKFLDGWRLVAVLLVIAQHYVWYSSLKDTVLGQQLYMLGSYGALGVFIFFVISGYVISRGIHAAIAEGAAHPVRNFYVRRFFRILPPLLAYVLCLLMLGSLGTIDFHAENALCALTFTCNLDLGLPGMTWYLEHMWSLGFEEQFYAVFPVLFLLAMTRLGADGRRVFALLYVGLAVSSPVLYHLGHHDLGRYLSRFSFLVAGVCAFLYAGELARIIARVSAPVYALVILAVVLPFSVDSSIYMTLYKITVLPLLTVILVFAAAEFRMFRRMLESSFFVTFGCASYGVYLWQQLVLSHELALSPLASLCGIFAVFWGCLISYRYFELPLIDLGRRLSRSGRFAAQAS